MSRSILQKDRTYCYRCGANGVMDALQCHHIFGGANRKLSEHYGLKVWLCGQQCHENGPESVHRNRKTDLALKEDGQRAFEQAHGTREDFRRIFGKSYL